jgi:hypothetical protein
MLNDYYTILFHLTVVIVSILSNSDIHPKGSKSKINNTGLNISLLYTVFDYNISFLILVIVYKPLFDFK